MSTAPAPIDNPSASRFETTVDGALAQLVYQRTPGRLVLAHTVVPDELEGRGIGGALVSAAVASAVADGSTIVPDCSFARGWLERHPDEAALASIDWGA